MLIVTPSRTMSFTNIAMVAESTKKYVCMITRIAKDKWGDERDAFVVWQGDAPLQYNYEHGYSVLNIRNLRNEFRIIRDGVDVP